MKLCKKCGIIKPMEELVKGIRYKHGRRNVCKLCFNAIKKINADHKLINPTSITSEKQCTKCGHIRPWTSFSKNKNFHGGVMSWCMDCMRDYRRSQSPEKKRIYAARYRSKSGYYSRIHVRMHNNISRGMRYCVNENKPGWSWEKTVGYTVEELMSHIEKHFLPGMSWANYGEWEIDHIKPKALFGPISYLSQGFLDCWSLTNLQPLWKRDNRQKYTKINWSPNASLSI